MIIQESSNDIQEIADLHVAPIVFAIDFLNKVVPFST